MLGLRLIVLCIIIGLMGVSVSYANYEVYSTESHEKEAEDLIQQYVQQMVVHSFTRKVTELIRDIVVHQNIQMFPAIVIQAGQQAAVQSFSQEDIREMVREVYQKSFDLALEQRRRGFSQTQMQNNIQESIDKKLEPILEEPLFKFVVEQVLLQADAMQKQIVIMETFRQQAQLANLQQQQVARQQQVQSQILQSLPRNAANYR